ncbi:GTPase regulator Nrf1 [Coemansia sp. RSA 1972]|nr:GTPase regulator Nrf1 [Coemansia sp. RSA 1972]
MNADASVIAVQGHRGSIRSGLYNGGSAGNYGSVPFASRDDQPNKRIAVPVRVEPKVFFANERTFLSWLNFAIVLGSLALGLLNFGDRTGKIAGAAFTVIAMFVMIYALMLFQWRAERIRRRDAGPYDDRRGPIVLVVVLISAILVNFYLRFVYSE